MVLETWDVFNKGFKYLGFVMKYDYYGFRKLIYGYNRKSKKTIIIWCNKWLPRGDILILVNCIVLTLYGLYS